MIRESRKVQHIKHFLATFDENSYNGFEDVQLIPDALSDLNLESINVKTELAGLQLDKPVFINAITGGDDKVADINRRLAICARKTGLAMAVGSQYAALQNPAVRASYEIVRKENPDGIIFANLGAYASVTQAREAVAMLDAQALQLHLNLAQELYMQEGDRDFQGYLTNIRKIADSLQVPVIVKETGCGVSYEAARQLAQAGIKIIDVSGRGGTNFLAIETSRTQSKISGDMLSWGMNTAVSTYEAVTATEQSVCVIASGGIRTGLDAVKAFTLGAKAVGAAGIFLQILLTEGEDALCQYIEEFLADIKRVLLLTGCSCIADANKKQPVFTGFAKQWLEARALEQKC